MTDYIMMDNSFSYYNKYADALVLSSSDQIISSSDTASPIYTTKRNDVHNSIRLIGPHAEFNVPEGVKGYTIYTLSGEKVDVLPEVRSGVFLVKFK